MAKTPEEIDLSGQSLHNLSTLRKADRSKCKVLNLHNNLLSDVNDMPRFLFLTELNISSNRLQYVPDLSFLPALTILDVSGNLIESVQSLSFLPGLKTLKLAYNCIKSLHGISGANVPNLEFLDIRENPISVSEHEIQPIKTLVLLTEISVGPQKLQLIALLFKSSDSLRFVDRKSREVWRDFMISQKQSAAAAAPARLAPAAASTVPSVLVEPVPTPHFDKIAAAHYRRDAGLPGSAEKAVRGTPQKQGGVAVGGNVKGVSMRTQYEAAPLSPARYQQDAAVSVLDGQLPLLAHEHEAYPVENRLFSCFICVF
jgi:Leucine-rich repeat (LRR) protein